MAASSGSLHESPEVLGPETIDRHRAIVSLMEELEAVDWYDQRVTGGERPRAARHPRAQPRRGEGARVDGRWNGCAVTTRFSTSTCAPICSRTGPILEIEAACGVVRGGRGARRRLAGHRQPAERRWRDERSAARTRADLGGRLGRDREGSQTHPASSPWRRARWSISAGPLGWDASAVSNGRARPPRAAGRKRAWRRACAAVQPLVELRVPFEWRATSWRRSAAAPTIPTSTPVRQAARSAACAEDRAVFHGYADGNITGIAQAAAADDADHTERLRVLSRSSSPRPSTGCAAPGVERPLRDRARPALLHRSHQDAPRAAIRSSSTCGGCWTAPIVWAPGVERRGRAVHARRRFRADRRAGLLDRLSRSQRHQRAPVPAGELHLPRALAGSRDPARVQDGLILALLPAADPGVSSLTLVRGVSSLPSRRGRVGADVSPVFFAIVCRGAHRGHGLRTRSGAAVAGHQPSVPG